MSDIQKNDQNDNIQQYNSESEAEAAKGKNLYEIETPETLDMKIIEDQQIQIVKETVLAQRAEIQRVIANVEKAQDKGLEYLRNFAIAQAETVYTRGRNKYEDFMKTFTAQFVERNSIADPGENDGSTMEDFLSDLEIEDNPETK